MTAVQSTTGVSQIEREFDKSQRSEPSDDPWEEFREPSLVAGRVFGNSGGAVGRVSGNREAESGRFPTDGRLRWGSRNGDPDDRGSGRRTLNGCGRLAKRSVQREERPPSERRRAHTAPRVEVAICPCRSSRRLLSRVRRPRRQPHGADRGSDGP